MAAEGVAFAVLLGFDGSALWRVVRVLVVIVVTALAVWFIRRAGRTGQGAAALLLGMAGTVAGAGAASGHLAEAGLDAAAVAAAIVLVTGLFLLGWGAAALVRAIPGWWRLLAVPAAIALLWFALVPLTLAVNVTNRRRGHWDRPPRVPTASATGRWRSAPLTGYGCRPGTFRRVTAPPWCCCPARLRRAAGRHSRPRPVRRACDGLRLVG